MNCSVCGKKLKEKTSSFSGGKGNFVQIWCEGCNLMGLATGSSMTETRAKAMERFEEDAAQWSRGV